MEGMNYSTIVQTVLQRHTANHLSEGTEQQLVFDVSRDRYLLMHLGWEHKKWVHACLVHIQIENSKIWIQRDFTEVGIANELVEFGVAKTNIVLGFEPPFIRKFTEFATG